MRDIILMMKGFSHVPRAELHAVVLSAVVGAALLGVKFLAYSLTGSAAVFSDALESIVNVLASAFALYALHYAHRPADESHPYGHGKIEFVSAGIEGGMIMLAACVIVFRAVEAIVRQPPLASLDWGAMLMVLAMIINGLLGVHLIRSGKKHHSLTLEADGHHLFSDAVTSAAALVALVLVRWLRHPIIDPIAALLIAFYIAGTAIKLIRRATAGLMDEQDKEDQSVLTQILDAHMQGKSPAICSWHKLRHRHVGRKHWVDFHLVIDPSFTVDHGHDLASAVEYEIEKALGDAKATAHVEPCKVANCRHHVAEAGLAALPVKSEIGDGN